MPVTLTVLLLAAWAGAIALFVYVDRAEEVLWIPLLFVVAGVFCSMLPLAFSPSVAVAANAAILMLFIVSLEASKGRRSSIAFRRHRV